MNQNTVFRDEENQRAPVDEILKTTALLYYKDALEKEQFEDCQELIGAAKQFGATVNDINQVTAEYIRGHVEPQEVTQRGYRRF